MKEHENRGYKEYLLINGRYFSAGEKYSVAQSSSATILLRNPEGSGKQYFIDPPAIRAEDKAEINKIYNPDSTSGESNISTSIQNKNPSSNYGTDAEVKKGFTFTGGNYFSPKVVGSSAAGIRAGGSNGHASNVLEPGDTMIIEAVNQSNTSGDKDISIDIDWYEVNM